MASVTMKYAMRSMWRNPRRTILSAAGIAVGVVISIVLTGFMEGGMGQFFDVIAKSGIGHMRVVPHQWLERRDDDFRLADARDALSKARSMDNVVAAAPRSRTSGLLALGNRVVGVTLTGVDPEVEPLVCNFVKSDNVTSGSYLAPGDREALVVGAAIADRLEAEVDDDLYVTVAVEDGDMRSAMLRIKGIVSTGNDEIDLSIAHVALADVQKLSGIGGVGEVTMLLRDSRQLDRDAAALQDALSGDDAVVTWAQILPGMGATVGSKTGYSKMIIGMCVFVVMLGIVSAQITAVLERRREFGMLTALGMKGHQVGRILAAEAIVLGVAGAAVGLALGTPLLYLMATRGVNIALVYGEGDIVFAGIRMQTIWYADMGTWVIGAALAVGLGSTLLATVYPAWLVRRLDPAEAMRVTN